MMLLVFYVAKQASHKKLEQSQQTTKIFNTLPTGCPLKSQIAASTNVRHLSVESNITASEIIEVVLSQFVSC